MCANSVTQSSSLYRDGLEMKAEGETMHEDGVGYEGTGIDGRYCLTLK